MESRREPASNRVGRPRSFDRDAALHRAMVVFWRHGFEGASIATLTEAMGITPPSLYAAFGDKASLFLEAAHLYAGPPADIQAELDRAPTARDAALRFLHSSAVTFTGDGTPAGCLLASATASGSPGISDLQAEVAALRATTTRLLEERIARDHAHGLLPPDADPSVLADMVVAVTQGMAVLARDGRSRGDLVALADQAMTAWPSAPGD